MAEEIREVLNLLNEKLAGLFPYRLEMVTPGELKLLEKNARYMKAEQFQSLVENIKKDGNLSSLPLCYREKDGKLRVLSGNHRVMAARQAGVEQVLVMGCLVPNRRSVREIRRLPRPLEQPEQDLRCSRRVPNPRERRPRVTPTLRVSPAVHGRSTM
jgi:hypothetical protein